MSRRVKMMIIDDDEFYIIMTKKMIEKDGGINLLGIFQSGNEALDYLGKNAGIPDMLPDIILLDILMPVMDGWQFMNEFLKLKSNLGKNIIINIVSSSISPSDFNKAKTFEEIRDYIVKPLSKEKLREIVA